MFPQDMVEPARDRGSATGPPRRASTRRSRTRMLVAAAPLLALLASALGAHASVSASADGPFSQQENHICPGNGFGSGTIHNPAFVIDTNNPGDLFTLRPSSKAVITLAPVPAGIGPQDVTILQVPALLVCDTADRWAPPSRCEALADTMPGSAPNLVVAKRGAGHGLPTGDDDSGMC